MNDRWSRDNRTRTYDRTDMSRVLYQLSYIPKTMLVLYKKT